MKTRFIRLTIVARPMSNILTITFFVTIFISCDSTNQIRQQQTGTVLPVDSILVDQDGNRYPVKKMLDNHLWMTANLKLNIPASYCYENINENCEQYGRLYTWQSAQRGCSLLGKGWRLPTNDDWQKMITQYSSPQDSIDYRKKAYKVLLTGGGTEFNALLGGGRDLEGKYARLEAHGFYWTATESDSSTAYFINFAKGSQALYQQKDGEKPRAFSVRCVCNLIH